MAELGEAAALGDPERLEALRDTGLSSVADAGMDRFARLVSNLLGVPVALVSLVEEARQVFPGMVGLNEPWAGARQTPLSHSVCRHVVTDREPLIMPDIRAHARTAESPAIEDLGVIGYAGMPLTDGDGHVLGSLCAIDTRPRVWTAGELEILEDLAAACSAELQLRIVSRQRETARRGEAEARRAADEAHERSRTALERSQLMLRAADALADTSSLADVSQQVRDLVTSDLKPVYVGLVLVEKRRMRRLVDRTSSAPVEHAYETYPLGAAWPTARSARENRTIVISDPGEVAAGYGDDAVAAFHELGLHTAVSLPLPGTVVPLGALVLGWDRPYEIGLLELAVLSAIAGYTARAVERALFVEHRIDVAHQLQQAMLTELPPVTGLETAALYRPAAAAELVGGDWYDLYQLPGVPDGDQGAATVALTIGDITGHNLRAATLMGQTRSMLRQADLDHPGTSPAHIVSALEHAGRALGIESSGTLVHAHLRPTGSGDGSWELTWTNAGHPPPLLVPPDGPVQRLVEHGPMMHPALGTVSRPTHRRILEPGTLLLLYTDGLVEHRGADLDAFTDHTASLLGAHRDSALPPLLTQIADRVAGLAPGDDVALLAVRVPAPDTAGIRPTET
ncbi:GAF domain-containing SpoIIE family protein phosphatase [Streptomyces sp. NPDC058459]|uniref:GAF domain-containing SpoIIE family protein phosphatase n=1 Tax=Streptomyces sp. NPDC058459 TaxID=3346508 RepID=UPI0036533E8C